MLERILLYKIFSPCLFLENFIITYQEQPVARFILFSCWDVFFILIHFWHQILKICTQSPWGLIRRIRTFRKFLEYVAAVKTTSLFCTLSYPEDALKINVKHVGFLKSDIRNESKLIYSLTCYANIWSNEQLTK